MIKRASINRKTNMIFKNENIIYLISYCLYKTWCAGGVMFELAESIRLSVDADLVNLYLVETDGEITKYSPDGDSRYRIIVCLNLNFGWFSTYQVGEGTTIAAYTAHCKTATKVSLPTEDSRYPHGVAGQKVCIIIVIIVIIIHVIFIIIRILWGRFSVIQFVLKMKNWKQSLSW